MSDWIEEGQKAPDFTLAADDGSTVKLSALRGEVVVLYFYPRDDTPGCTREACAFRDQKSALTKVGAIVLGVSTDTVASHQKFRDKYDLNFRLLADTEHRVAEKYGAWREKNMYGKVSLGIQRSTFVIDREGVVRKAWKKVNVDGHDAQVLETLQILVSGKAATSATSAPAKKKAGGKTTSTTVKKAAQKSPAASKKTGGKKRS